MIPSVPEAEPLRVLVLAPHSFYVDRGTPIDVDILVRALCERGCEVDLACYADGDDRDYEGLSIHRIDVGPGLHDIGPGFSARKVRADRHLMTLAFDVARRRRPHVVHAGEEAVFIARRLQARLGVPYVYDMDSSIAQQMTEKMSWLRPIAPVLDHVEAIAIRGALACAPVCHALGDLARSRRARHVEVLHDISQIDPDAHPPSDQLRRRLGIEGTVFMYVGNLEAYQGVDLLLEAFALARRRGVAAGLVIAGGRDAHIAAGRRRAEALGAADSIHFIGRWPAARLGELLAEADVLTAPRIRGINTPQKIFPSLHSGRAVLLTDLPTHTQIVDDTVCRLAAPDPESFAEAIGELAADAELRERLGRAGRAFVEREHVYEAHRRRVDRLYDHVEDRLGRRPARPDAAAPKSSQLLETTA